MKDSRFLVPLCMLVLFVLWAWPGDVAAKERVAHGQSAEESDSESFGEMTEPMPSRLKIRASTVVSLYYILPTVSEPDDPRKEEQNNKIEFNLRNAYIHFQGDIQSHAIVLLTLSGRRVGRLDLNDDGTNDDPNFGRLALVLDRAALQYSAHPACVVQAGVIRLPWTRASQDAWDLGMVANSAPRRYGLVEDSDLGISLHGLFPGSIGSYHWAVYNGETRVRPEQTPHKATSLRLSFLPFYHVTPLLRKLGVAGYGEYRKVDDPPGKEVDTRISWAILMTHGISPFSYGAEWMTTHTDYREDRSMRVGGIGSVFIRAEASWWSTVFLRADVRDPDLSQESDRASSRKSFITEEYLNTDGDGRLYVMGGANFLLGGSISISPWIEGRWYQETYRGTPLAPTVIVSTSLYLGF